MQGENLTYKIWRFVIALAALWWVVGLNLFIYHIVAGFMFLSLLYMSNRSADGLFMPHSAGCIFWITAFYGLSIFVHVFFVGAEGSRIVASLYNLSFWIIGFFLILVLSNKFSSFEVAPLLSAFRIIGIVIAILALAMLALWFKGTKIVELETPLYFLTRYIGKTQLAETSLLVRPLMWDWFASATWPRFNVFSPYPTAAGGIIMIVLIMMTTQAAMDRKTTSPAFLALFAVNLVALFMTLSRMSIMAFFFSFVVIFLLQRKNIPIWLLIMLLVLIIAVPFIQQLLGYVLSLREGSNSIRMELYLYSIEQLKGADWILGFGVKPRSENFMFPLGSHSTYVSMLFKSGLVGLILLIVFQGSLMWRWYSLKAAVSRRRRNFLFWRGLGWAFMALGLWIFTEDIDAPQLLAFLYFSLIGIFEGFRRRVLA